jgi:hypothetical protein
MRRALVLACAALALSGCVNRGLVKVGYDGAVARTSDKPATIRLTTGVVQMDGNVVYTQLDPRSNFNEDDQRVFAQSLKDELNRLELLRVGDAPGPAGVSIEIVFQRTIYFPMAQRYILDTVMQLSSAEKSFARRYQVYSSEGESTWTNLNTDVAAGKALAAKKLMARLIPDIEAFVAGLD